VEEQRVTFLRKLVTSKQLMDLQLEFLLAEWSAKHLAKNLGT
jgi:hypothetical protein